MTVWRAPSPDDPEPPDEGDPEQVAAACVAEALERTTQIPTAWETCIAQGRRIVASLRPALAVELTADIREKAKELRPTLVPDLYHRAADLKRKGIPDVQNTPGISADFIARVMRLVDDGTLGSDGFVAARMQWMDAEPDGIGYE